MKRLVMYSLSATVAVAMGSVARAEVPSPSAVMDSYGSNLIAQQQPVDPNEGIISPDSQSPNNRVVPGQNELDSDGTQQLPVDPNEGIISPDSQSPNNRVVPDRGAFDANAMQTYPGETFYSQQCRRNLAAGIWQEPAPTDGIISPDDRSPYNRALPRGPVSLQAGQTIDELGNPEYQYMECRNYLESHGYDEESYAPTEGIISPGPQSPNNRVIPGPGMMNNQ